MAWSLTFTGRRSIVKDSYQRLALWVDIDEVNNGPFQSSMLDLSKENFLHVNVDVPFEVNSNNVGKVMEKVKVLYDLGQGIQNRLVVHSENPDSSKMEPLQRLFASICFKHDNSFLVQSLLNSKFFVDAWIIMVGHDKDASLRNIINIDDEVKSSGKTTSLGIGGCSEPMTLDWFLTKISPDIIQIVHLGDVQLPNVPMHSIELAHTQGYNTMCHISPQAFDNELHTMPQLLELAAKYEVTPDQLILKYLLQLGCIVSVPYKHIGSEYLKVHFSRLCHPFVHRRPFVSANKVLSFLIHADDMAVLTEASETCEAKADEFWTPHATSRAVDRELTYKV